MADFVVKCNETKVNTNKVEKDTLPAGATRVNTNQIRTGPQPVEAFTKYILKNDLAIGRLPHFDDRVEN